MRILSLVLLQALLLAGLAQGGGLFSKLFSRGESGREPVDAAARVKMLELELVKRPACGADDEFATVQFRVKQLSNPDPQFVGPPVRLRHYVLSGAQLGQQWIRPNGDGLYEASIPLGDSGHHYLYFETGDNKVVLAKVPWVVLRAPQ